ncbi:MAG: hypothetical protein AAEI08_09250, partial [Gammaproteobacteria bacterium]
MAVQLISLMFTFSRGSWVGASLAIVVFLGFVVLSLGWRMLVRTGLVLGLAVILSVGYLHWNGSVTMVNLGSWLGLVMVVFGLSGTFAILFTIKNFARSIVLIAVVGAVVTIVGAAVLAPSALSDRLGATPPDGNAESTADQFIARILSLKTEVSEGFGEGRGEHWKVSWALIKNRPWFEFDDLSLPWLRHLIGYGPDLFRYVYLLESPPDGPGFLPLEPDHAHNFFIHQTVEQGVFGGVASLALFASVFGIATHHLLRRRQTGDPVYRLLLFGLMAVVFGRFFEMMVGVARISDLTVLWVILGLFVASASFNHEHQEKATVSAKQPPKLLSRKEIRRASRTIPSRPFSTSLIFRLAIVAWLVCCIGVVTWQKSINPVRAAVAEGHAVKHFLDGDFESAIEGLDKAIKLAPGVPSYHHNRARVSLAYQIRTEILPEPRCDQQVENPYLVCLALQSLNANLESVNRQPFNYRARIEAANSALNLKMNDYALYLYQTASTMAPNSYKLRNDLAEIQINLGFYDNALEELAWSLGITGESPSSGAALHLKGRLLAEIERYDDAVQALKHGLSLRPFHPSL